LLENHVAGFVIARTNGYGNLTISDAVLCGAVSSKNLADLPMAAEHGIVAGL